MANKKNIEEKSLNNEEVIIEKKTPKVIKENNIQKQEYNHNSIVALCIFNTILVCLVVFGCVYIFSLKNNSTNNEQTNDNVDTYVSRNAEKKNITITETGLSDAVEKVYDAVVVIENYSNNRLTSSGSGFVFKVDDQYGYILTNHHVISGAKDTRVTFTNDKTVSATIVGSDEYSDIAVLSVPKDSVVLVADIGSSENMRVGDTTFTVGAPLDSTVYSWSVTRGILSGKNRTVETDNSIMEVLQTDAAINSGNSGGPLCNINGEVIGITNMKIASSSIEGIGFAIPIEDAMEVADALINGEKVNRPYLGVSIYDASERFSRETYVYINYVEENSLAEKSGLKAGDKILKMNDVEIINTTNFKYNLYKYKAGDKITITVERDGKELDISITLK